jgi:hypothetical protein
MACLSSTLMYGQTGVGKTGQVGSFAKWVMEKYGKKTRLYTSEADLGTIEHLLGDFIDHVNIKDRPNACETIALASQGFWPDASGKWVSTQDWSGIGAVAYEGCTEFANDILTELRIKGASGEIISAEKAPAQFVSGQLRIAGNNQTHYGIAQGRLKEAINSSQKLPVHILWTAREMRVQDQETRQFVYGPLLAGKAATQDAPAWFGNCIHLDMIKTGTTKDKGGVVKDVVERRAYFFNHYDKETEVPYLAKLRVPPEFSHEVPEYLTLDSDLETMVKLFNQIEDLRAKARDKALAKVKG